MGISLKLLSHPWPQGLLVMVSLGLHGILLAMPVPYPDIPEEDPVLLVPLGDATDPAPDAIDVVRLPRSEPAPDPSVSPPTASSPAAPTRPNPAPRSPSPAPSGWLEFSLGDFQDAQVDRSPSPATTQDRTPDASVANRPDSASAPPREANSPTNPPTDPAADNPTRTSNGGEADGPEAEMPVPEGFRYNNQVEDLVYSPLAFTDWYLQQTWNSLDPPPLPGPGALPPLQLTYDDSRCLSPPPAPGRLEIIVTPQGQLARPPRLLGTTGYAALDDQAKADATRRDHTAAANPNRPEPTVYWLPVEVVGNGSCEP